MEMRNTLIKSILLGFILITPFFANCQKKKSHQKRVQKEQIKKIPEKTMETIVLLETSEGNIKLKLYNETRQHKDNFLKLIANKTYEGVIFHRVIKNFMIQTGDPTSKNPVAGKMYGSGDPGYTVPAEILPQFIHKKGALAAARTGDQINPERRSSGSQFYIVYGKPQTDQELTAAENSISGQKIQALGMTMIKEKEAALKAAGKTVDMQQIYNDVNVKLKAMWEKGEGKFYYTAEQKEIYKTIGGAPHLDGAYTIFGEVVEGMEIVEKINLVETANGDRPKKDIFVKKISVVN